jgi:thiol-disulfide isomerase/thioredoxin
MITSFVMNTAWDGSFGSKVKGAVRSLAMTGCLAVGGSILAAPPAPPITSTGAPHPSAPVVKVAGMTLEIRSGRVVVTDVAKGSAADRAGVQPLDVVLVANDRSLVDLDPISPQQVLGLLVQERTLRTRMVLGRGAGTLSVDLPEDPVEPPAAVTSPVLGPGVEAPAFSGHDIHGKEVSLKDRRGRLVLIDFWASTCPPCERAVIPLRRIAEQFKDRLTIVGIGLDVDRKAYEAFVYNHHLPGDQLFDGESWGGPIPALYGVKETGIPYYVLLDRSGAIAALGTSLDPIEAAIVRLNDSSR